MDVRVANPRKFNVNQDVMWSQIAALDCGWFKWRTGTGCGVGRNLHVTPYCYVVFIVGEVARPEHRQRVLRY